MPSVLGLLEAKESAARETVERVREAASDGRSGPSAGLPPLPHQRPDRLRQAAATAAVRLLLPGDRRRDLFGGHCP
ncbi:hypothetical protein GCM10027073_56830 [Streptomyces chlorus]